MATKETTGVRLVKRADVGACMDCVKTETPYACATCKRHLCTGCARDPRGCPNCTDGWDRPLLSTVTTPAATPEKGAP